MCHGLLNLFHNKIWSFLEEFGVLRDGLNWSYTKSQLDSNAEKASETDKHGMQQVPKFEKLEEGKSAMPISRKMKVPMAAENIASNLVPSMLLHVFSFFTKYILLQ